MLSRNSKRPDKGKNLYRQSWRNGTKRIHNFQVCVSAAMYPVLAEGGKYDGSIIHLFKINRWQYYIVQINDFKEVTNWLPFFTITDVNHVIIKTTYIGY